MEIYLQTIASKTYELLKKLMNDPHLDRFNLVGGTSLSLQMGHRKSVDLDMFNYGEPFDLEEMKAYLQSEYGLKEKIAQNQTLIGMIGDVKVDFIKAYNKLTEPLIVTEDGIRLVSYKDIAAMKLLAIGKEGTRRKDFIDVAYLSTKMSFGEMLQRYLQAYDLNSTVQAIRGLLYFDDIKNEESLDLVGAKMEWRYIERRLYRMVDHPDVVFDTPPVKPVKAKPSSL